MSAPASPQTLGRAGALSLSRTASDPGLSSEGFQSPSGQSLGRRHASTFGSTGSSSTFLATQMSHPSVEARRSAAQRHRVIVKETRTNEDAGLWGAKGAEGFRTFLKARFGSIIAGWRAIDLEGNGRLSFQELCRACRSLGYHGNLRKLWDELDRNGDGHITVGEIDPEVGETIGAFKLALMNAYGDMLTAWREGVDINNSGRIEEEEIRLCCERLGLSLDHRKVFRMLAPHGSLGVTLKDFDPDAHRRWVTSDFQGLNSKPNVEFIEDVQGIGTDVPWPAEVLSHKWSVENTKTTSRRELWRQELKKRDVIESQQAAADAQALANGLTNLDGFKRALIKRCGSLYGAWRYALDLDENGRLTFFEFCNALHRLGIHGDLNGLWRQLDLLDKGIVDFVDLDSETDTLLQEFREKGKAKYGNMLLAWMQELDTSGNGFVDEVEFVEFCKKIGFIGDLEEGGTFTPKENAQRLFRFLKPEAGRCFLSLRDIDLNAYQALSRGDFRMLCDLEDTEEALGSTQKSAPGKLEMTFDERMEASFFCQYTRALNASKKEKFAKSCRAFLPPEAGDGDAEDFNVLCKRRYGSVVGAWRYCLDPHLKGKLSKPEFSSAARRLGFSGEIKVVWDRLNPNPEEKGFVSLKDLDAEADTLIQTFVRLVDARFGGIEKLWSEHWRRDPSQSATPKDVAQACQALHYVHDPGKLFKCLAPRFGARQIFLLDLLPLFDMVRRMMALGTNRPRAAMRRAVSSTPSMSALATRPPEEPSVGTHRTPAILREMMKRVHGNTVAAWCKVFDAQGRGFVTQYQFSAAMPKCELYGNVKGLWKELTKGLDTLPFTNIDPQSQAQLDGCREHLVAQYGSILAGWHSGLNSAKLGRLDEGDFVAACEHVQMPPKVLPKTLFRMLFSRLGQRSVNLVDLRPLLVGVPPAEREATWGEPIKLGITMGSPAKRASPKEETEAFLAQVHADDWIPDQAGLKTLMIANYGSIFAAWRTAIDKDRNGVASKSDFFEACRIFGLSGGKRLWAELDVTGKGQITLEEFDAETAEMFGEFEDRLVGQFAHPREGWKLLFDTKGLVRCDLAHFVAGCERLGYTQDVARLFKLLQPESSRHTLSFDDVWLDLNRNVCKTTVRDYKSALKASQRDLKGAFKGLSLPGREGEAGVSGAD